MSNVGLALDTSGKQNGFQSEDKEGISSFSLADYFVTTRVMAHGYAAATLICPFSNCIHLQSMISSTTWSLSKMCKMHLKSEQQDIDADDTATYFDGSISSLYMLTIFVHYCELDTHYQMATVEVADNTIDETAYQPRWECLASI